MTEPVDLDLPLAVVLALLALLALPACAADIRPEPEVDGGPIGKVSTVTNSDGTFTTRVDATLEDAWTHVDLATGVETEASGAWNVAAQRFHLKLAEGGEVAPLPGALGDVTAIPADGWLTDLPDGDDEDANPDYAFEQGDGWYAYDVATHVLTPRPLVWVVRTGDATAVKVAIEDYYDDVGSSGVFTLRWAPL